MPESKFCINCAHADLQHLFGLSEWYCLAPENNKDLNLVTGQQNYRIPRCKDNRAEQFGACGPGARWFIPKASIHA